MIVPKRACAVVLCLGSVLSVANWRQGEPEPIVPQQHWQAIDRPESAGFSSRRLQALAAWVASLDTTAMMVVAGGRTLFTYGDVAHVSYLASGRKSILALLYGKYVENGTIHLERKLSALDFTDVGGLLPREREATIQHLLTARSGVYHPPSNGGDDTLNAPPRGSKKPGEHFLYNNWDFNAAGGIFEKLTGRDIYDALESDLARPIGMEDFDRSRQRKSGTSAASQYPAYHVWLSTRDMARVGLLALRGGRWGAHQVISSGWMRRITSLATPYRETNPSFADSPPSVDRWGYGYLWWVWDAATSADPLEGAFTAWGVGGQYITIVPRLDLVIAHKTDTGFGQGANRPANARPRAVNAQQYAVVLRMVVSSKCGSCE
jgi:CubicO group peptidase (beta-lactamase class C family)